MAGLNDNNKSAQWHQSIQKSLRLSSQLSETQKSLEGITKSFSATSMIAELAKSIQNNRIFDYQTLSAIETVTKGLSLQEKFAIPTTTLYAIKSINQQHEQLFGGLRAMAEALKIHSPAFAQINNLNFALRGISGQIAAIAAHQRNWTIIDEFEQVTKHAIEFSESLTEEVTKEQQSKFQTLFAIILAFFNKHKKKGVFAFVALDIFLNLYQLYNIFSPEPEKATKEDVRQVLIKQDTLTHYIQLVNQQLRQAKEYRITNRECEVKLKPKSKTLTLSKLPKDFEIIVIKIHHKWVYVSYNDPKDNLPQTGWIMKKYLDKPE